MSNFHLPTLKLVIVPKNINSFFCNLYFENMREYQIVIFVLFFFFTYYIQNIKSW